MTPKTLTLSLALWAAVVGGACGGQKGTLSITLAVPTNGDPFLAATQVVVNLGGINPGDPPIAQKIVPVSGGHFDASIQMELKSGTGIAAAVIVEARDGNGRIVGYGRTPVLALLPVDETVTVWVGRPGEMGRSPTELGRARSAVAASPIPRLGVVIAGGVDAGDAVADVDVYHDFQHQVLRGEPLPAARSGAVAVGFERVGALTGAVLLLSGGGATPARDLLAYDPVAAGSSAGRWQTLLTSDLAARISPSVATLPSGSALLAGGLAASGGSALDTAVEVSIGAQLGVTPTQRMTTPRGGAIAVGGQFAGEDGALIVGGNAAGSAFIERYVASTRTFLAVAGSDALAPRTGHTVTRLADNRVLVVGGQEGAGMPPTASAYIISPGTLMIERRETFLPTARTRHVAFVTGSELLFCGGIDVNGQALASCDVLNATTFEPSGRSLRMAIERADIAAVPLESGEMLLAGGVDGSGQPLKIVELYTPAR